MEWTALVGTVVGAAIGVCSTLVADRVRWRRDTGERDRETLRTVSAQFLEALTGARDAISDASRSGHLPVDERAELARASILAHGVHAKQYQLELVATPEVGRVAGDTAYRLLLYRDAVAAGHLRDDLECATARRAFRDARRELMTAMRSSLARR
ncbi:hypothetical protein SSP531S_29000 [Streptomyces spongiicola]|uniref:Uncharacterized protein n=1 Tax=Streptomyces spongiicola TaxID=1690221 RepID=A0A2S1Z4Y4_9ACTN|nr:hypothetical protein [Streptomyces spongiicola]AWK11427.1 hypothetical protein DDQ41_23780 [Streptomyces spongiicola]GBQ01466.1 hypothetical protein SSP531S_29000 [Streptomyces spongiicola]